VRHGDEKWAAVGARADAVCGDEQTLPGILLRFANMAMVRDAIVMTMMWLPRIFDAFYVTKENNLAKHGLGIGLWLARSLVQLHAGTIVAKSEGPTRGAEFCAAIPLVISVAARSASAA
jgi:light-regulated signal transduction histidine kinase (bacteriophytochrome)